MQQWDEFYTQDIYDELFADEFVQAIANNQVLILIKDGHDNELYYDVATYDSAFPYLENKRYSGDRTFFYIPFPYIVDSIGRRFEGQSQDVIDFLSCFDVSLPTILGMDTIQRACGMSNLFGVVLTRRGVSLPTLCSTEHSGLVCVNDSLSINSPKFEQEVQMILSKLGWSFDEFQVQLRSLCGSSFDLFLLNDHSSNYDLLGGRMKFHEALNMGLDPFNQVSRGCMEGFVREALEELGLTVEYVTGRDAKNGVHTISAVKDGHRMLLKIRKHSDLFLGIVDIDVDV